MTPDRATAVALRTATRADLPAIMRLEQAGFPVAEQWSETSWRAELEAGDRIVLVATEPYDAGSAPSGGTAPLGVVTFLVGLDTADLMRVVVAPEARGRRVGRALVRAGMMHVRGRGVEQVLLEVRHDNAAAIALYTGCGFTTLTTRTDYYGPGADALVMRAPIEIDLPPFVSPQPKGTRHE